MISFRILCCLIVSSTLTAAELPAGVDLPIDRQVEASIVAATKYFHPEKCVPQEFKTVLKEYDLYWAVTLVGAESDVAPTCSAKTVYVCKANGDLILDDPETACDT